MNGYLDPLTGRAKFLPTDAPYFDLVCTCLLRTLHERLGRREGAGRCEAAVLRCQAGMQPLQDERAVITRRVGGGQRGLSRAVIPAEAGVRCFRFRFAPAGSPSSRG